MIKKNIVYVPFVFLNMNDVNCVSLLFVLILLKLYVFPFFALCFSVFVYFLLRRPTSCTILILIIIIIKSACRVRLG